MLFFKLITVTEAVGTLSSSPSEMRPSPGCCERGLQSSLEHCPACWELPHQPSAAQESTSSLPWAQLVGKGLTEGGDAVKVQPPLLWMEQTL